MAAIRCAIYTRKSAEERADAQLGSIERQRELCEAYVASQAGAGWVLIDTAYDDPGYSGGNLKRPALQQLLADVDDGAIEVVVVYKIDRLSRSLRDFVGLVDRFDRVHTTFVSVTQSFSTTTSMGRFTLNILLSFAQFEREMTGERTRDWKAGARARGLWTSGPPPFGYRLEELRLVVHPERAAVVKLAFRRFAKLESLIDVARELNAAGHRNRLGRPFDGRMIRAIVSSRTYRGEMPHRGNYQRGSHPALVGEALWQRVRAALDRMEATLGSAGGRRSWSSRRTVVALS